MPSDGWRALLQDALDNLHRARQRTGLCLVGIGIGAAAVVSLLSIGDNTAQEMVEQFRSMGTNLIVVQDSPLMGTPNRYRRLHEADALTLMEKIPALSLAAPISSTATKAGTGKQAADVMTIGATEAFLSVGGFQLEHGRFIAQEDGHQTVVVVGHQLAKRLKADTGVTVGDRVRIDSYLYTVVGILKQTSRNPLLPFDVNETLIVPIKADRRLAMSTGHPSTILIRVRADQDPAQTLYQVVRYFQLAGVTTQVQGAQQLIEGMKQQGQLLNWLLGGIACISLLVGGLGAMNAMLASIAERKGEIGLRLALGAKRTDIMAMVTAESILLAAAGGGTGTMLGALIAVLFALFSGWVPTLSGLAIALGFGMSLTAGLFFGIYPAIKAAELSPIEALRASH